MFPQAGATAAREKSGGRSAGYLSGGLWPASILLALYCGLSIAFRLILPNSLTLDEAEQSLFSQYWLAGYGPQPPFYNWVQNVFVSVLGISLFSLTLPKFAMLLLCYVFYGLAAREMNARPGFVTMAMLSLFTLPQVSFMPQQDLTHTVAVLMASALFLYGLFRSLLRPDWQGYAVVGVAIGIGALAKYNFVLLPVAAGIAVFCDRDWRCRLFDRRMLLTISVSLALVLPHGLWLLHNLELATTGTLGKMIDADAPPGFLRVVRGISALVRACLAFGAVTVVILTVIFQPDVRKVWKAGDRRTKLLGLIMLLSLAGVLAIILATGTTKLTERWLDPYLLSLPLYLLLKLERANVDTDVRLRRFQRVSVLLMIVTLIPQMAKTLTGGLTGSYTRINYPMASVAEQLAAEQAPATIVAADIHLAGNMRLQFPAAAVISARQRIEAFGGPAALKGPVLAIWTEGDPRQGTRIDLASLSALGFSPSPPRSLSLPYYYGDGKTRLNLGYIWLR